MQAVFSVWLTGENWDKIRRIGCIDSVVLLALLVVAFRSDQIASSKN